MGVDRAEYYNRDTDVAYSCAAREDAARNCIRSLASRGHARCEDAAA
jgi:hypothetical protein